MRQIFLLLTAMYLTFSALHAETRDDTTFILRKAGESPEHPEKITHAEISMYLSESKGDEYKKDFLRLAAQLPEWPNLRSLLITHVDEPEMLAAFRKTMAALAEKNKLRSLDIRASFALAVLPEEIFRIHSLEVLALWDLHIKDLPPAFANLVNLREFYILGNDQFYVSADIAKLDKLRKMDLQDINFSDVNAVLQEFAQAGSVRDLSLIGCNFNAPPQIARLFPGLTDLTSDDLCDRLEEITGLKNLETLSLACAPDDSLAALMKRKLPGCIMNFNQEFCFPPDAQIKTISGTIKIRDITPGTIIKTFNPNTGKVDTTSVVRVERHPLGKYPILHIHLTFEETFASLEGCPTLAALKVTLSHPIFLADLTVVKASELNIGDRLIFLGPEGKMKTALVTAIENQRVESDVFNLITSGGSYLAEGIWVRDKF